MKWLRLLLCLLWIWQWPFHTLPLPLTRAGSPDGCHLTMLNIIVLGIPKVSAMSLKEVSGWQEPQTLFLLFSYHETSLLHLQRLSWYGKSRQLVFFLDYCILLRFQLIHSQPLSWSTRATPARSWQQSLRWAWRKVRERTPAWETARRNLGLLLEALML